MSDEDPQNHKPWWAYALYGLAVGGVLVAGLALTGPSFRENVYANAYASAAVAVAAVVVAGVLGRPVSGNIDEALRSRKEAKRRREERHDWWEAWADHQIGVFVTNLKAAAKQLNTGWSVWVEEYNEEHPILLDGNWVFNTKEEILRDVAHIEEFRKNFGPGKKWTPKTVTDFSGRPEDWETVPYLYNSPDPMGNAFRCLNYAIDILDEIIPAINDRRIVGWAARLKAARNEWVEAANREPAGKLDLRLPDQVMLYGTKIGRRLANKWHPQRKPLESYSRRR